MRHTLSNTSKSTRTTYSFQGQERDDEVKGIGNSYTAEFWQYDSRAGRRWNLDPVFKEHESSYACYANNPICFRDPNGTDTLNFNKNGKITKYIKGGVDVFNLVDINNKILKSKQFKSGTIQYKWKYNKDAEGHVADIDILQIKGHKKGREIFEFFAENTIKEWGFVRTIRGNNEYSFITTSHKKSSEAGSNKLIWEKLAVEPYIILEKDHSHPSNNTVPSGSWTIPERDDSFEPALIVGTYGDVGAAKAIDEHIQNKQSQPILYQIYIPKSKKYIKYDKNSRLHDFD